MLQPSYPIRTPRMTLRPYGLGDLGALHDLFGREDVCRYLIWEPMDIEQARALLERRVRQTRIEAELDAILLAAVDAETGRVIGEFMLRFASAKSRQGEIGWSIHPDVQGRGLATEGAREMLRLGFDELGLHRIVADCDPRNLASLRVMERLGMRREAQFVENEFLKGEWIGEIVCAMLETEWRELHARPAVTAD
jgi:RimJ/RimL family protein N-acetyltransferase